MVDRIIPISSPSRLMRKLLFQANIPFMEHCVVLRCDAIFVIGRYLFIEIPTLIGKPCRAGARRQHAMMMLKSGDIFKHIHADIGI